MLWSCEGVPLYRGKDPVIINHCRLPWILLMFLLSLWWILSFFCSQRMACFTCIESSYDRTTRAVVLNDFCFVVIPLTVDCGIFRSKEISQFGLLHRWHPITVPCWNSLSSREQPILSQMFVEIFGWVSEYFFCFLCWFHLTHLSVFSPPIAHSSFHL